MMFRSAVLIIHGFAGGTYDQEDLANYLELNKKFDKVSVDALVGSVEFVVSENDNRNC